MRILGLLTPTLLPRGKGNSLEGKGLKAGWILSPSLNPALKAGGKKASRFFLN